MTIQLRRSSWSFVSSGGADISIGAGRFVSAGGTIGAFLVKKDNDPTVYTLNYVGSGGNIGIGASVGGVVTASISLPTMPGDSLSHVYLSPRISGDLSRNDFSGTCLVLTGSAGVAATAGASLVFFGASPTLVDILTSVPLLGQLYLPQTVLALCKGVGSLWGVSATSAVGAGFSLYRGQIF